MTGPDSRCWIVLDTSVVMGAAKGNANLGIDLRRLANMRGASPVSLSQPAHFELARHLLRGTLTFSDWRRIVPLLDAVLDTEHPIVPSRRGLFAMLGAREDPTFLRHLWPQLRAHWAILRDARRASDVRGPGRVFVDGRWERRRSTDLDGAATAIGDEWGRLFEGLVEERGRLVERADRDAVVAEARQALRQAGIPDVPEVETVVQILVDYIVLHSKGYAQGTGYKPKRNDGLDFDQLFVLGLPAFLCSSDGPFVRKVNALGTAGSDRVVLPETLFARLAHAVAGTLGCRATCRETRYEAERDRHATGTLGVIRGSSSPTARGALGADKIR